MPRPRAGAVATAAQRTKMKRRTVASELTRLRDAGSITPEDYTARRAFYDDVKRRARTLTGVRKTQMRAVLATVEGIAAARGSRRRTGDTKATKCHGCARVQQAATVGRLHVFDVSCFAVGRLTE